MIVRQQGIVDRKRNGNNKTIRCFHYSVVKSSFTNSNFEIDGEELIYTFDMLSPIIDGQSIFINKISFNDNEEIDKILQLRKLYNEE